MCLANVTDLEKMGIDYGEDLSCEFIFTVYDVMEDFTSSCFENDVDYNENEIMDLITRFGGNSLCNGLLPFYDNYDGNVTATDIIDDLESILIKKSELKKYVQGE